MVYGETFLRNVKFYAKTLTKLHDLTVLREIAGQPGTNFSNRREKEYTVYIH
jgi:hypothetical protein